MRVDPTQPGAVYRRVSTDNQDAERQVASTTIWLRRHGLVVPDHRIYEDIGWSRADAHRRPAFQRLLIDADAGLVKWIVVDRQDRFGTRDKFELFAYLHRLRQAKCHLFTVDDKDLTSAQTADSLTTHLDADQSERELSEKSVRILEGKLVLAKKGFWLGGRVPFGLDVAAFREVRGQLIEQWRVEVHGPETRIKIDHHAGTNREYNGKDNFPPAAGDEVLQLRPSNDPAKLDLIRWMYEKFAHELISENAIARQLNDQGVRPPPYSRRWLNGSVRDILRNPAYLGRPAWNKNTSGEYFEWTAGRRNEKEAGAKARKHASDDWVMPDHPIFQPIVTERLWETVQKKIEGRPSRVRSSRPHIYFLSGLVYCGNCGGVMTGTKFPKKKVPPKDRPATYLCGTYNGWCGDRKRCPCKAYRIYEDELERHLRDYLDRSGTKVEEFASAMKLPSEDRPAAVKAAVHRYFDAYARMIERLGGKIVEDGHEAVLLIPHDDITLRALGGTWIKLKPNDWKAVADRYTAVFSKEEGPLRKKLVMLDHEHSKLVTSVMKLSPSAKLALEKANTRIEHVESQMHVLKEQLLDAADETRSAVDEGDALFRQWRAAKEAIGTESNTRRKAEVVRSVIEKIIVTFRPSGRTHPCGEVAAVEFVPRGCTERKSMMRSA